MKFYKFILLFILIVFSLNGCSDKIDEEHKAYLMNNLRWIKLNHNYSYSSNSNDTFSFKIVEMKVDSGTGGQSVGAPDFYRYTQYFYRTSKNPKEKNLFIGSHISSDNYAEQNISFLDSEFDLILSEQEIVKNYLFLSKNIGNVYLFKKFYVNEKDPYLKKLWWSNSYGILKFESIDGKIWSKILSKEDFIFEYFYNSLCLKN